ncbi:2OG-Fe dioxygenase family protein [Acinetobacter venetianus]|uniref:2OG-Fe dioxygenase family protein n=1 Tax=Acinetobacter venetianus TaxID=52133 RepID=UPI0035BE5D26
MYKTQNQPIICNSLYKESSFDDLLITEKLRNSFSSLKKDKYMKNGDNYRYRAFLQGFYKNNKINWFEKTDFFQSNQINSYQGGITRNFPPVDKEIHNDLENLLLELNLLKDDFYIGCHQIRITVDEKNIGCPAPEGFHQDGFDYVMIIAIAQFNISGGITLLRKHSSEEIIYKNTLQPYKYLIFKDSLVDHYTTPITHLIPHDGYRDVLVITLTKI